MSQDSPSAQSALSLDPAATLAPGQGGYALTSDLAKLCLPITFKDEHKRLAWVNSICFLFLVIGLIGLKPPKVVQKPLTEIVEIVPVVFTPPEEPEPVTQSELQEPTPETAPDTVLDAPVVATVVAPSAAGVAFAVPVKGPVLIAPSARYASPPPAQQPQVIPKPTTFIPSAGSAGRFPDPTYPRVELQARHQGKVMLYVVVDPSGTPVTVEIKDSCGWPSLDRHAADWVKSRWQWPPGQTRYYYVPIIFQIR